jgi:hypothetical protein
LTPTSTDESTENVCGAVVPKIVTLVPGTDALAVFVKLNVADEDDPVVAAVTM